MTQRSAWRLSLASLTALVIATMLLLSVGLAYLGVTWYSSYLEDHNRRSLSPEAAEAYDMVDTGRVPDAAALRNLVDHLDALSAPTDLKIQIATLVIGLVSALICAVIGVHLARRIARPLEDLTEAADILRSGDFSVRVALDAGRTREIASLVETFNSLSAALETMEKRLRFNNMAVAHELRTPLTVLQGALQAMLDGVFQTDRKTLADLLLQVEGLGRIVEDLRLLSLAIGQKLVIAREETDLATEVGAVLSASGRMLEANGMVAETDLSPALIKADAPRIRQAVLALLQNATRYAASGGWLRCETGLLPDGGGFVRISDRGPGFPEDMIGASVNPFWRGDESRSRAGGGTGLGLSVVQAIAAAHGGRLLLGHGEDGGAEVTLVLNQ